MVARLELATGDAVAERCALAQSAPARLRGLLARRTLEPGEGLLLRPCGSIHTFFLRFPVDVVFCDSDLRVLAVSADVRPWRVRGQRGARVTVELAAGEAGRRGVTAGAHLRLA